jgi:transposase
VIDDPDRLEGVRGIGVDEKRFLNATVEHRTVFTTQIVDLDRHRVLDVVDGRSRDVLAGWLADRGPAWCEQITLATLDPAAGYRTALIEHLANATLIVDHFHAIKLANAAIDDIRGVQQEQLGRRGRKGDPLYRARRVFLTGIRGCPTNGSGGCSTRSPPATPVAQSVQRSWPKKLLREVYTAHDLVHARRRLVGFFQHCADADFAELARLARTIDRWRDEVLAYHHTGQASNGRVENVHMRAEKIRRKAHGFVNHHNYTTEVPRPGLRPMAKLRRLRRSEGLRSPR